MTKVAWRVIAAGVIVVGVVSPEQQPVLAESADNSRAIEEIVVTATKRETSLMDTGISITAFSSEMPRLRCVVRAIHYYMRAGTPAHLRLDLKTRPAL